MNSHLPQFRFNTGEFGMILVWDPDRRQGAMLWMNPDIDLQVPHLVKDATHFAQTFVDNHEIFPTAGVVQAMKKYFVPHRDRPTMEYFQSAILDRIDLRALKPPR